MWVAHQMLGLPQGQVDWGESRFAWPKVEGN
jgi:hypothetical protein